MNKYCTNCGSKLSDNATFCVKCGKAVNEENKNKKKGLPAWAIVLIVLGSIFILFTIIFAILMVIGFKEIEKESNNYINNMELYSGTIGDTLSNGEFNITLDNALIYSSIEGEEYTDIPSEGKEYLILFFTVENISEEREYINDYEFLGYEDNKLVSHTYLINNQIDDYVELSGLLDPNKITNGYVAYEVDSDWKEFEVNYDNKITFTVVNEDNGGI